MTRWRTVVRTQLCCAQPSDLRSGSGISTWNTRTVGSLKNSELASFCPASAPRQWPMDRASSRTRNGRGSRVDGRRLSSRSFMLGGRLAGSNQPFQFKVGVCIRIQNPTAAFNKALQYRVYKINRQKKCLQRVKTPNVGRRIPPAFETDRATKIVVRLRDWAEANSEAYALATGLYKVEGALGDGLP